MPKKLTKEEFIKKANEKHNGKYDYYKVGYVNSATKVCIICPKPEHGEFWQTPNSHLRGCGCPKCKGDKTRERCISTKEIFIEKACKKHDNKYDYSKVYYVNNITKVCIICPEHGEFEQTPKTHLKGCGCQKCGHNATSKSKRSTKKDFIKKAREVHGDKYYYSKVDYVNNRTKVCIICPEHDEFWQTPDTHARGIGCPKCSGKYCPTKKRMDCFCP